MCMYCVDEVATNLNVSPVDEVILPLAHVLAVKTLVNTSMVILVL